MTDKFLSSRSSNLQNGTANLYINAISVDNLEGNLPVKTNAGKQLITQKLAIDDIDQLQSQLNAKISNPMIADLNFQNFNGRNVSTMEFNKIGTPAPANAGTLKIYAANGTNEIHMIDEEGNDSIIGGEIFNQLLNTYNEVEFRKITTLGTDFGASTNGGIQIKNLKPTQTLDYIITGYNFNGAFVIYSVDSGVFPITSEVHFYINPVTKDVEINKPYFSQGLKMGNPGDTYTITPIRPVTDWQVLTRKPTTTNETQWRELFNQELKQDSDVQFLRLTVDDSVVNNKALIKYNGAIDRYWLNGQIGNNYIIDQIFGPFERRAIEIEAAQRIRFARTIGTADIGYSLPWDDGFNRAILQSDANGDMTFTATPILTTLTTTGNITGGDVLSNENNIESKNGDIKTLNGSISSSVDLECKNGTTHLKDAIITSSLTLNDGYDLYLGNSTSTTVERCIKIKLLTSAGPIQEGHLLKIVNDGGVAKVRDVLAGDPATTPIIGISANPTVGANEVMNICIGGTFKVVVENGATVNIGDTLIKSNSDQGRVRGNIGIATGAFGVALTSGTGNLAGSVGIYGIFIRNDVA